MALFPALEITLADGDLVLAIVDDYDPTAVEERELSVLVFFPSAALRSRAHASLAAAMPHAVIIDRDVDDEDWARRSQADLPPVVVGRLTILPSSSGGATVEATRTDREPPQLALVVQPSMGFGTGHHATTRLCLAALQAIPIAGAFVLDVGTGSGILALAAKELGARAALGIDCDADAIQSARENLPLNPTLDQVTFAVAALGVTALPVADVVVANLTGALLVRSAAVLQGLTTAGGHLIVSGLLDLERDDVCDAFLDLDLAWEQRENEWIGLCFKKSDRPTGTVGATGP